MSAHWTDKEKAFLRANYRTMTDEELAAGLCAMGSPRSAVAVNRRRIQLRLCRPRGAPAGHTRQPRKPQTEAQRLGCLRAKEALMGWPVIRGEHEDRDRIFSDRVIEEGRRLGLLPAMPRAA